MINYELYKCQNCDCAHRWYQEDFAERYCTSCKILLGRQCDNYRPRGNLQLLEWKYEQLGKI